MGERLAADLGRWSPNGGGASNTRPRPVRLVLMMDIRRDPGEADLAKGPCSKDWVKGDGFKGHPGFFHRGAEETIGGDPHATAESVYNHELARDMNGLDSTLKLNLQQLDLANKFMKSGAG